MLSYDQQEAAAKAALEGHRVRLFTPILTGIVFDALLQGMLFCQIWTWMRRSWSKEWWTIRVLVLYIASLSIAFTAVSFTRGIQIFAIHFGEYLGIGYNVLSQGMIAMLFMTHIAVQSFFAHRAYMLSGHNKILALFLACMILTISSLAISLVVFYPTWPKKVAFGKIELQLITAATSITAGTDVFITLIILFQLWKRRVGAGPNNWLIARLMIMSIESQLPPSIFAVVICVLDSNSMVSYTFPLVAGLTKVSALTFFTVLNARRTLRAELNPTTHAVVTQGRGRDIESSEKDDTVHTPELEHNHVLDYHARPHRRLPEGDGDTHQYSFEEIISKSERSRSSYPPPTPYLPSIRSEDSEEGSTSEKGQ